MVWPILTVSLSIFLLLIEVLWIRTGDVMYYRHARHWSKLLALWTAYALHKARGNLERLLAQRKLLLAWVLCIPLPYVAVE
ncbi:cytochrome ubiquinol oxidase subunit I, partial [Paraburkholderia sp. BR10937]|uniref:cytochrome ubiquinol oxidase subunit I n=1 Tax=Paraburkholderia sp. BR10937 TaxID=3236994 RepID=UPI0034D27A2D